MMFSRIARMSFHAAENPRSFSEADGSRIIPQGRSCPLYVIQNAAAPARQRIRSVGISPHSVSAGGISLLSATASARFSIIAGSSVRSSCAHLAAAEIAARRKLKRSGKRNAPFCALCKKPVHILRIFHFIHLLPVFLSAAEPRGSPPCSAAQKWECTLPRGKRVPHGFRASLRRKARQYCS